MLRSSVERARAPRRRAVLCVAVLMLGSCSLAFAARWLRLPLWGAEVRAFAVDPFAAGSVYLGTSRGNFYGSADGGQTWKALHAGAAFPGYVVTALVADPTTPGRLWAALAGQYAGGLVAVTEDRGATWTTLARWQKSVATRALAVVPGAAPTLAIGGDDGVRLSRDGGRTWTPSGTETDGLAQVESLAFDPSERNTLYAGTWRQAFRTRDGGATWSRIAEGMVLDATVYAWDFDPKNPRDIWVSTCGWVYHSENGGDHWRRYTEGFRNRRSHALRRDPTRPNTIYAATVGGLHRSTDGGQTWERMSRESLVVTALAVDPRTGRLYVGTEGEGVFVSDDAGKSLERAATGLAEGRVADLVPDPNDPSRVYFFRAYGGEESGVWMAEDARVQRVSADALPPSAALAAFRDAAGKTVLLLSSAAGLLRSTDGGAHWTAPASSPPGAPVTLFGAPFASPVLVTSEGVYRIEPGGQSWAPVEGAPSGLVGAELLAGPDRRPVLEVRTADTDYRWDGRTWNGRRRALLGGGMFLAEANAAAPTTAYSSLQDVDGKLVWEEGSRRVALTSPRSGLALATAAAAPGGRVYVGTTGDGLYLFEP
ncbi:MAG TPA: hypothetical protein VEG84_01650 [Thermoanaerobaculia bacterium]|nr:hypothetical protein [Thermoanaerobaculia bacterium]